MNSIATSARWACRAGGPHRRAFTLTELLFVMMILAILAALSLSALSGATQQARIERTRAIINRLDKLITEKYDSYRTRAVPIRILPGTRPVGDPFQDNGTMNGMWDSGEPFTDQNNSGGYDIGAAEWRLYALRELMRCEMPNTGSDVLVDAFLIKNPSLMKSYQRRLPNPVTNWTGAYEGAECLYLIVSSMRDGEDSALDFFAPSEIGDIDNDGMKEIWDAFGNPVEFVRWPAGYSEHRGPDGEWGVASFDDDGDGIVDNPNEAGFGDDIPPPPTPQTRRFGKAPDPFDPMRVDGRYRLPNEFMVPFALKPLVYSAGPDREYSVQAPSPPANPTWRDLIDPYFFDSSTMLSPGSCFDSTGQSQFADNITNHDFSEK